MKLLFKQRLFSWFDSYDIYDEAGNTYFSVEGKFGWGHCLHILDAFGNHVGTVKERVLAFLPNFELYEGERCLGRIKKDQLQSRKQVLLTLVQIIYNSKAKYFDTEG